MVAALKTQAPLLAWVDGHPPVVPLVVPIGPGIAAEVPSRRNTIGTDRIVMTDWIATNPSNALAQFRIGQTLLFQGKYEEALSALRSVPKEVNPALVGHQIAFALFNLGRKEEASSTLEQFLRDYPEDNGGLFTSVQAIIAASVGEERIAEEEIQSAIERGKGFGHFHHTAYHIACAYALMRKPEPALKWLAAAAEDGFPCYPLFEHDTNLQNLREDARFVAFLAKLRQQWESYRSLLKTD